MDASLAFVVDRYVAEAATCTHTSTLIPITPLLKQLNERIFHQLLHYQQELDVFHAHVVKKHLDENEKEPRTGASGSISSPLQWASPPPPPPPSSSLPSSPWFRGGGASSALSTASPSSDAIPTYPENIALTHYWYLQQIIPIPDVHQVSDYDTIYRFLLARHPPLPSSPAALHPLPPALEKAISMAVFDILHYIRFREMYDLNHILQDPFLTAELNGRDAMPLIQEALSLLDQYDPSHRVVAPSLTSLPSSSAIPMEYIKLIERVRSHLSRHVLYDAWRTWLIGVDLEGHVVLYQKPKPEQLRALYKRWKYVEKGYDKSLDAFWTVSASACLTPPPRIAGDTQSNGATEKKESTPLAGTAAASASSSAMAAPKPRGHDEMNFIARLYFRGMEKGRRISRLLHHAQQQAVDRHITHYMAHHPSKGGSSPSHHTPSTTAGTTNASSSSSSTTNPSRPLLSSSSPIYYASGSVTCLVDVSDVSVGTYTSSKYNEVVRTFKLLSLFGQSYYPDNMHRMIIINGGLIFRLLFKLIKPWLDPETQKKIIIVSSTNHYSVDELIENVDRIHLASPVRFASPLSPCANALEFPSFAPEEKVVEREPSTALLASEASVPSTSPSDPSISSEEEDLKTTTTEDVGAEGNGPISTVEATSTAWQVARTLLAGDASSGEGTHPIPLAGSLLLLSQTTPSIKKEQKYFDLFTSLSKFLPSTSIPSWYGGNLAMVFTPYHYGHLFGASGTVPAIAMPPSSRIGLAEVGMRSNEAVTSVVPPFIFPPPQREGAAGVTLASYPTTFQLPSLLPQGGKGGERQTPLVRWTGEYGCIQYFLSQLQQRMSVSFSSPSSTSVIPLSEEETPKVEMTRETGKDTQETAALPTSISAFSFLRHHPAFLRSNVEKKYWQQWHTLLSHPRFSEALDAVMTFAPAEIVPDALFLPMLYANHLQRLQKKTSVEPTFSSDSSSSTTSLWRSFCQQYLTGDGGNVCIGPVTDVECDVFNAFLHYRYGEEKWSSAENKKK